MKKKLLSLLLAASMLSALCACGSPANSGSAPQSAPESKAESAAAPETKLPPLTQHPPRLLPLKKPAL